MIIIGAGLSGLVAAAMLRDGAHEVYEAQSSLPHNHSAVLRFRSSVVGDATGIVFKQVKVLKSIAPWRNPTADMLSYSQKTNGSAQLRSIISATGEMEKRYIAPLNLVEQLRAKAYCLIHFDKKFTDWRKAREKGIPLISTLPMPMLMEAIEYDRRISFHSVHGFNIVADLDPRFIDAYCTLYVPDPAERFARISITGSQLIAECYGKHDWSLGVEATLNRALDLVGLRRDAVVTVKGKPQVYAKILPIDEGERRRFIMWASDVWGVYSLGRFATWRPGLLLDDVVNDVRVIQKLVANRGEQYAHRMKG